MYLQIELNPEHPKFQKILWRFSPDTPVQSYELNTVTFGVTSSPYLALRVVRQLAEEEKGVYPRAAKCVEHSMFMGDFVTQYVQGGRFDIVKWITNCSIARDALPAEVVYSGGTNPSHLKVLGLHWDPASDVLAYFLDEKTFGCTKRKIFI